MHEHKNPDKISPEEHQHLETLYELWIPMGGAFQYLQHKLQPAMAGLLPALFSEIQPCTEHMDCLKPR